MARRTLRLVFAIGIVFLFLLGAYVALAYFTSPPLNISKTSTEAGYPAIAVSQNGLNIGMVWATQYVGGSAVQGPIYIKTASDGQTIDHKITVDSSASAADQSKTPDVASDPNTPTNMHVVWTNLSGSTSTIYYARCSTTAGTCSTPEVVQQVSSGTVADPKVATTKFGSSTIVHVVWKRDVSGNIAVYYSGRQANGTWSTPVAVSNETGEFAYHPAIATSSYGGNTYVHVAWASDNDKANQDNEFIKYKGAVVNAGTGVVSSWGSVLQFSHTDVDGRDAGDPDYPSVVAISSTVMVLWDELQGVGVDPPPPDIDGASEPEEYYLFYALSHDSGASFPVKDDVYDSRGAPGAPMAHRSDPGSSASLYYSPHSGRLQVKAAAQLATTTDITGYIDIVWHETNTTGTPHHDVYHNQFCDGDDCGALYDPNGGWRGQDNETNGQKLPADPVHDPSAYSMSPDVAVANGEVYALYMEGDNGGEYDIIPGNLFDVIYKGTVVLTDTTTAGGGVYLPIIMKNKS